MAYIKINGLFFNVTPGTSILEVCLNRKVDVELPRFCYHEILSLLQETVACV